MLGLADPTTPKTTHRRHMLLTFSFLDAVGVALVVPLIAPISRELGASAAVIGFMSSIYGLLQLLGSPLMGRLSDRIGRRNVFLLNFVGAAVSYGMMAVAPSLTWVAISRLPVGILKQSGSVAQAFLTDMTTPRDRARAMGQLNFVLGAGFIVGPALSGALSSYSSRLPLFISSALFCALIPLGYVFLHEDPFAVPQQSAKPLAKKNAETKAPSMTEAIRFTFSNRDLSFLMAISFLSNLSLITSNSAMPLIVLEKFNMSTRAHSFIQSYMGALSAFTQGVVVHRLSAKVPERNLLFICTLCSAFGYIGIVAASSPIILVLALAPLTMGKNVFKTCMSAMMSKSAPADCVGTTLGVASSQESVARIIAPTIGGMLIQNFSLSAPPLFGVVCCILILSTFSLSRSKPVVSCAKPNGKTHNASPAKPKKA